VPTAQVIATGRVDQANINGKHYPVPIHDVTNVNGTLGGKLKIDCRPLTFRATSIDALSENGNSASITATGTVLFAGHQARTFVADVTVTTNPNTFTALIHAPGDPSNYVCNVLPGHVTGKVVIR